MARVKKAMQLVVVVAIFTALAACSSTDAPTFDRLTDEEIAALRADYPYVDLGMDLAGTAVESDIFSHESLVEYTSAFLLVEISALPWDIWLSEVKDIIALNGVDVSTGDTIYVEFLPHSGQTFSVGDELVVICSRSNRQLNVQTFNTSSDSVFYKTSEGYILARLKRQGRDKYSGYKYEDFKQLAIDFTKSVGWK